MRRFLVLCTMLCIPLSSVWANELDRDILNQQRLAKDLPKTLVVRVEKTTGAVSVLHSRLALSTSEAPADDKFVPMKTTDIMKHELDMDSSTSGCFFYWWNSSYYYPAYNYGGYNYFYQPYYSYNWGNYYYSWYSWY